MKNYIQNLVHGFGMLWGGLLIFIFSIFGKKVPGKAPAIQEHGDQGFAKVDKPLALALVAEASHTMKQLGVQHLPDDIFDCFNTAAMKAELINMGCAKRGIRGGSIAGVVGYWRDSDHVKHYLVQIVLDGNHETRMANEGHPDYTVEKKLSKTEWASIFYDVIG